MASLRRAALATAFALASLTFAGEENESPHPNGPTVEIIPSDGKSFICHLLSMKDGTLSYEMLRGGEKRSTPASEVRSVRFLPPEFPAVPHPPDEPRGTPRDGGPTPPDEQPPPPDNERRPMDDPTDEVDRPDPKKPWTLHDTLRMRELAEKERNGKLTLPEVEEIKQLRARAPGLLRPGRLRQAEENARIEFSKGRLDSYIASQQKRLKEAEGDEEARDAVSMLAAAYRHKNLAPKAIGDQLKKDVEAMDHEAVRGRLEERVPDILEQFRSMRKFAK